jgi:hypothetical protein
MGAMNGAPFEHNAEEMVLQVQVIHFVIIVGRL